MQLIEAADGRGTLISTPAGAFSARRESSGPVGPLDIGVVLFVEAPLSDAAERSNTVPVLQFPPFGKRDIFFVAQRVEAVDGVVNIRRLDLGPARRRQHIAPDRNAVVVGFETFKQRNNVPHPRRHLELRFRNLICELRRPGQAARHRFVNLPPFRAVLLERRVVVSLAPQLAIPHGCKRRMWVSREGV
jgi:hypothetical protein